METKRTMKKRVIAFLCIISMLSSCCFDFLSVWAEETSPNVTTVDSLKDAGYSYWTLSDLGIADKTFTRDGSTTDYIKSMSLGSSLDKTVFAAKMKFPTENKDTRWYIGSKSDSSDTGFLFRTNAGTTNLKLQYKDGTTTKDVKVFDADTADTTLRGNANLQVAMSVEYVSTEVIGTVEYATLKIGMFFDGKLYNNEYITTDTNGDAIKVPTSILMQKIWFYSSYSYAIASYHPWERSYEEAALKEDGYDYWTLSDLAVAQATTSGTYYQRGTAISNSLDKTIYTAKMNFNTGNKPGRWYIGGTTDGKGFAFRASNENSAANESTIQLNLHSGDYGAVLMKCDPVKAGVALKGNQDLTVSLSVAYETPTNATEGYANLKVGIFFNGKQYKDTTLDGSNTTYKAVYRNDGYYTVENVPTAQLGQDVYFYSTYGYTNVNSNSLWDRYDTDLKNENFEYWTLSDLGVADKEFTRDGSTTDYTTPVAIGPLLDQTVFSAKMKFPVEKKDTRWYIGSKSGSSDTGLLFRTDAGETNLKLQYKDGSTTKDIKVFDAETAGTTLRGNENLTVSVSVEYIHTEMVGTVEKATVKIGVFFNGKLYNNEYITTDTSNAPIKLPTSILTKKIYFYSSYSYAIGSNHLWERTFAEAALQEQGYEYWTLSDVKEADRTVAEDGEKASDTTGFLIGTSLDKTIFTAKIDFPEEAGDFGRWFIGGKSDGVGFTLRNVSNNADGKLRLNIHWTKQYDGDAGGKVIVDLDPKIAGTALRGNPNLILSLAVAYTNVYTENDVEYADMSVGVYLNGKLYNNQYYDVTKIPTADLAQRIYFFSQYEYTMASHQLWERVVEEAALDEAKLQADGYEYWTLADMGVTDNAVTGDGETIVYTLGNQIGNSLDHSIFTAKLQIPDEAGDFGRFYIGGVKEGAGFCFRNVSTKADGMLRLNIHYKDPVTGEDYGAVLKDFYPGVAKTTLRDNPDLVVSLSVDYEKVYTENNVEYADIKLGVYFDGKLYNNEYIYVSKVPTSVLCRKAYFYSVNDYAYASNYLWAKSMNSYPSGLTELKASDFGLEGTVTSGEQKVGVYNEEAYRDTAITMKLALPKETGSSLYLGSEASGIRLTTMSKGRVGVAYVDVKGMATDVAVLEPSVVGLTSLTGAQLKWQFVCVMRDTWDEKTFLNFGVYIDGKMYGDTYFLLENVDSNVLKHSIGVQAVDGTITIADSKYEYLSLCDFNIYDVDLATVDPGEKGEGYKKTSYYDYNTMNDTEFTGIYNFKKGATARFAIGDKSFWHGVIFNNEKDGTISVRHVDKHNESTKVVVLTPEIAGVASLTDTDVKVRITFDVMELGDDKADLKLGIYINDKLYNGQHYVVNDIYTSTLTRVMKLWALEGPYKVKSVHDTPTLEIYGFDEKWRKTLNIK